MPSAQSSHRNKNFVSRSKNLLKNSNWTLPVMCYFTWKLEFLSNISWMIAVVVLVFSSYGIWKLNNNCHFPSLVFFLSRYLSKVSVTYNKESSGKPIIVCDEAGLSLRQILWSLTKLNVVCHDCLSSTLHQDVANLKHEKLFPVKVTCETSKSTSDQSVN